MQISEAQRIQTALQRLTVGRAANLDNLDALVSSRAPGVDVTTLLTRLTAARATNLDNLNAAITTRSSHAAADVWGVATRALTDKAGFGLAAAEYVNIRQSVTDVTDPANSIGKALYELYVTRLTATRAGYLDAAISSRAAPGAAMGLASPYDVRLDVAISTRSSHAAADVWGVVTRALTDKAGFGLAAAEYVSIRQSVTDTLDPANSIGKALYELYVTRLTAIRAGYLDAAISSRAAPGAAMGLATPYDARLDVAISTRAAAADYTAIRAGYLDNINQAGLLQVTTVRAGYMDNLIGTQTAGTYSHLSGLTEQDAVVVTPTELGKYERMTLDLSNLTQTTTVRTYVQVDGINYRLVDVAEYPTDFPTNTKAVVIDLTPGSRTMKVTLQSAVAEGVARDVPYFYVVRSLA